MTGPATTMLCHTVGEWAVQSRRCYQNPFAEAEVEATFTGPSHQAFTIPGFYDGDNTWRVRFNPGEAGVWTYRVCTYPHNSDLADEGEFEVLLDQVPGFLRATPGHAWGFQYESGEPVFLLGDTTYNLFGMAHCGADVASFLKRRADQGFNLLRVRLPVSPFHSPEDHVVADRLMAWARPFIEAAMGRRGEYFGEVFRLRECATDGLGQAITPEPIVRFINGSTAGQLEEGDRQCLVLDPATGTGRFLVDLATRYPNRHLFLHGVEIDLDLYRACLLNMRLYAWHRPPDPVR
jgi:hypothetical protein